MSDRTAGLHAALYTALSGDGSLTALLGQGQVFSGVKDGASLPYIDIAEATATDYGSTLVDAQEHTITVHVWTNQPVPGMSAKAQCMLIVAAVRAALHEKIFALPLVGGSANLIQQSQAFNLAPWDGIAYSVLPNVAPDPLLATLAADKIVENTADSLHATFHSTTIPLAVSTPYSYSFFAKAAGRAFVAGGGSGQSPDVLGGVGGWDLSGAGSYISGGAATGGIMALGDGWYRCFQTAIATGASAVPYIALRSTFGAGFQSYLGDGVSGVLLFGAQLQQGGVTDYIPNPSLPGFFGVHCNLRCEFTELLRDPDGISWHGVLRFRAVTN
jgi:Protein of unknown function (DUF3168)